MLTLPTVIATHIDDPRVLTQEPHMDVYQNIYWDDIPDNEALIVQDMHYLHEDDILTVTESPLDGVTYITVGDYSNIRNIMLPERKVLELLGEM